eukprot:TRINITY_DN203_c1_g5_i1.p1 TRINITY_DN203_c1_g5~~TRINITY_DN203_c1_g5_i1.p1  ORF type:complete len:539 (-),score=146.56 TRINITY_DN203_c1_g5_i1:270-1886(-)
MAQQNGIVGRALLIPLTVPVAKDQISCVVKKDDDSTVGTITVNELSEGKFQLKYMPDQAGDFKLYISLGGKVKSTQTVSIAPAPTVTLISPKAVKSRVGDEVSFSIIVPGVSVSDLSATFVKSTGGSVEAVVKSLENNMYTLSITPDATGIYTANKVVIGDQTLNSTLVVDAFPAPEMSVIAGKNGNATVNKPYTFTLRAKNTSASQIRVPVTSPSGSVDSAQIIDKGNEEFEMKYTPTVVGVYTAVIHIDDVVNSEPLTINSRPDVKWIELPTKSGMAKVGEPFQFEVEIPNSTASRLSGKVVLLRDGHPEFTVPATSSSSNVYIVAYTPTEPGLFTLQMFLDGAALAEPIEVRAHQPVATFGGSNNRKSTVGNPFSLRLSLDGMEAKKAEAKVTNSKGSVIDTATVERDGSEFTLTWVPKAVGSYALELFLDGSPVNGAKVFLDAQANISFSVISNTPFVNNESTFSFDIDGADPTKLDAIISAPDGNLGVVKKVEKQNNGSWDVTFTAPSGGGEFTIKLKADGVQVKNSVTVQLG